MTQEEIQTFAMHYADALPITPAMRVRLRVYVAARLLVYQEYFRTGNAALLDAPVQAL